MHILITRPHADAEPWRQALLARGVTVSVDPLLEITFLPPPSLALEDVQAVIATSRNGLRGLAGSTALEAATRLPVYTVGPGTAEFASELGFTRIHQGPGTARDLAPLIARSLSPRAGAVLHLSGDKLAFNLADALLPAGFEIRRLIVYRSSPASSLKQQTIDALRSGAINTVMLMSPLSAKTFVGCAADAGIAEQCQQLVYLCLSDHIANAVPVKAPGRALVAARPDAEAMFTLIERLAAGLA